MNGEIEHLGIAVVYLVSERNERLLDLHLSQIEKNTTVPYTIYGSANRLLPKFRATLAKTPNVKICECETFDISTWTNRHIRRKEIKCEHSSYLEQLIKHAIEDGVSHVAILHVDSFPIKSGWAEKLASRLSEKCVLAAILRDQNADRKPLTACMLFHKDFYLKYKPRLLPTEQELSSPEYQRYQMEVPHMKDSGSGYGFKIFTEGLTWSPLTRSNKGCEHFFSLGVYDELVFHLSAAAYNDSKQSAGFSPQKYLKSRLRHYIKRAMNNILGRETRLKITDSIPLNIRRPDEYNKHLIWEQERQRLLEDPEAYLEYLNSGKQHT